MHPDEFLDEQTPHPHMDKEKSIKKSPSRSLASKSMVSKKIAKTNLSKQKTSSIVHNYIKLTPF